jgi:hypothetical protein
VKPLDAAFLVVAPNHGAAIVWLMADTIGLIRFGRRSGSLAFESQHLDEKIVIQSGPGLRGLVLETSPDTRQEGTVLGLCCRVVALPVGVVQKGENRENSLRVTTPMGKCK